MKTTNYYNTFIRVADDCPVQQAEIPPQKKDEKTAVTLQFELLQQQPYQYTSDDILFTIYAIRNKIASSKLDEERKLYFSKGQACLRSSSLPKRYGWGVHSNAEGKVAIYPIDSAEYVKLAEDEALQQLKAMRSKRA